MRRPFDWVEAFGAPWVLHLHMGMSLTKLVGRLDIGEEGGDDHLNRLAMQGETAFGGFLQGIPSGPLRMLHACLQVEGNTRIPDQRRFLLCTTQSLVVLCRQMIQLVDFDGVYVVEYIIYGKWFTSG